MKQIKNSEKSKIDSGFSLTKIRTSDELSYSTENSLTEFYAFLEPLDYTHSSKLSMMKYARQIHERFHKLSWLQNSINEKGIIETSHAITTTSAKGSTYLYFLAIIGLIEIGLYDYFDTNPRTIKKIHEWISPYFDDWGIEGFARALVDVSRSTKTKEINLDKQEKYAYKVSIYLILRYRLARLSQLTLEQWQNFILDCRDHDQQRNNFASVSLMHTALFNLGILEQSYTREFGGGKTRARDKRFWEEYSQIVPYIETFLEHIRATKAKDTIRQYMESLEVYTEFLVGHLGEKFEFSQITRASNIEYVDYLYDQDNSLKWVESRSLCTKMFLIYVSENKADFNRRGLEVFTKKVVIESDFKIKQPTYTPRPIDDEVLQVLMDAVKLMPQEVYRNTFYLALTTGLARADLMILKMNCLKKVSEKVYSLLFYRKKVKAERIVQATPDAIYIIQQLQSMNTQKVGQKHPDGTSCIFLINDGGNPLSVGWFSRNIVRHRELAAQVAPHLADQIRLVSSHNLRHTFAKMMREKGLSIYQIRDLLGQTSLNVARLYTKENDRLKIDLIDRLQKGQYVCESLPKIDQIFLSSENGMTFIENMLRFENRFGIGRCTVNGYENCGKAFKCLTCEYLCSTKEDLPEIVALLQMERLRYENLKNDTNLAITLMRKEAIAIELKKIKYRIQKLYKKIKHLRKVDEVQTQELVLQLTGKVSNNVFEGVLTFE